MGTYIAFKPGGADESWSLMNLLNEFWPWDFRVFDYFIEFWLPTELPPLIVEEAEFKIWQVISPS